MIANRIQRYVRRQVALRVHRKMATLAFDRPVVAFSFDDVIASGAAHGAALLEARGLRGTFYVAGGLIGRTENGLPVIDDTTLTKLAQAGHEIGCHTLSHVAVPDLDADTLARELDGNLARLRASVPGLDLSTFAWPFGLVSPVNKPALSERFLACRTVMKGINAGPTDLSMLRGVDLITGVETPASVDDWIARTVAARGLLIFILHDVSSNPSAYGATPDLLRHAIDAARKAGCEVVPVVEALRRAGIGRTANAA
jgi:peptidoglycan/xylan/chitin deacetylase (PgdA/CDA1 family)